MEFTVIDYQATPSGYYQIAFRNTNGDTLVCTQHGRGGCNMYSPFNMLEGFREWLATKAQFAIDSMNSMGFPDLAQTVIDRGNEWEDIVVMGICDAIDMGKMTVQG